MILQIPLMHGVTYSYKNCPVRELLHLFFWHRNTKFNECELCTFSIDWQEGIFLTARKYRSIYLHMGKKCSLSVNLTSYTPLSDSTVTHQVFWASFLTLLTDLTQELQLCSPAAAAISLLFGCSHILLFSTEQTTCAWQAEGRQRVRNLVESVYMVFCRHLIVSLIFHSLQPEWMVFLSLSKNWYFEMQSVLPKYDPIQNDFTAV